MEGLSICVGPCYGGFFACWHEQADNQKESALSAPCPGSGGGGSGLSCPSGQGKGDGWQWVGQGQDAAFPLLSPPAVTFE